jgi:D-amino-acid dehydrogenase
VTTTAGASSSRPPAATEIAVIGAGAIGAAAAYELARHGHEVVLLDRDRVGRGASSGTACLITPSHSERMASPAALREGLRALPDPTGPFSLRPTPRLLPWLGRFTLAALHGADAVHAGSVLLRRMALDSLGLHQAWHAEIDTGLERRGLLNAYLTDAGLVARDALVAEHHALGMAAQALDAAEVAALEPAVRGARGGAFHPDEAHLDGLVFVQRVAAAARRAGAVVCEDVEVVRVGRGRGELTVATTAGTMTAKRLVVATGVTVAGFARDLGVALPIQPAKGYHVEHAVDPPPLGRPVFLAETRVVATPLPGRLRLAGTLELGTDPQAIDRRRVAAVAAAGRRHVAGLASAPVTGLWRGLRPMSADGLPIVGRAPGDERVLLALGHGMLGITLAPHTAGQVTRLARGEELGVDGELLAPERFTPLLRRRRREPATRPSTP